jgi:hypothetical protein
MCYEFAMIGGAYDEKFMAAFGVSFSTFLVHFNDWISLSEIEQAQ